MVRFALAAFLNSLALFAVLPMVLIAFAMGPPAARRSVRRKPVNVGKVFTTIVAVAGGLLAGIGVLVTYYFTLQVIGLEESAGEDGVPFIRSDVVVAPLLLYPAIWVATQARFRRTRMEQAGLRIAKGIGIPALASVSLALAAAIGRQFGLSPEAASLITSLSVALCVIGTVVALAVLLLLHWKRRRTTGRNGLRPEQHEPEGAAHGAERINTP